MAEHAWTLRDPGAGEKKIADVTTRDVLDCLEPIWHGRPAVARQVRQRISAVMLFSVGRGWRPDDPAASPIISRAMPKQARPPSHYRALPHEQVGEALRKIRNAEEWIGTRLALEFLVLTATRSGEVRGATWREVDFDSRTWKIPGPRMKTGRPHRVALSSRAIAVLEQAKELGNRSGLVFPSTRGKEITDGVLSLPLRKLGLGTTAHGFRSSFRSWCAETGVPRETAEAALAHVVGGVEGAYQRSDLLEGRREVMEAWGEYVAGD